MKKTFFKLYRAIVGVGIDLENKFDGRIAFRKYVKRFGQPHDDISRTIAQQWCQERLNNSSMRLLILWPILFLLSFCFLVLFSLISIFKVFVWSQKCKRSTLGMSCVASEFLPTEISRQILPNSSHLFCGFSSSSVFYLWWLLLRSAKFPIITIKLLRAIWLARVAISSCQFVVVSMEYSSVSSVFTRFCELNGCETVNVMHGEKGLNSRDAFSRFTRFYVWDEYYISLFESLLCSARFLISRPATLQIKYLTNIKRDGIIYFLQGVETEAFLESLRGDLDYLRECFSCPTVVFKRHPRYTNPALEAFLGECDMYEGTLSQALSEFEIICGRYTTVLFQAHLSRVNIDDYKIVVIDGREAFDSKFIMHRYADFLTLR